MPELPEAESIARILNAALHGERFQRVIHLRSDMVRGSAAVFRRRIRAAGIDNVRRRGKRIILDLETGACVVFALGMSGHLCITDRDKPVLAHTHLRLSLSNGETELRLIDPRRFGWIELIDGHTNVHATSLDGLGIEPLDMSPGQFRELMNRRRQVKALLMDQHAIAGLGNIYCDESLHRADVHPLAIAADIDRKRVDRLHRAIRTVLREAIRANGSTIRSYARPDGGPGSFQKKHRVYGREGQPCLHCGTAIERIVTAARSTHLCPSCQRA